jgi:hypothetical protein
MIKEINLKLAQLIIDLDEAIAQAVGNPLQFAETPLTRVESACTQLTSFDEQNIWEARHSSGGDWTANRAEAERLVWQVRTRAGRLQLLLDSATRFYTRCFSLAEPEGLAYGMQGEWSAPAGPSYLRMDC